GNIYKQTQHNITLRTRNRSSALERPAKYHWGWGRGLKVLLQMQTSPFNFFNGSTQQNHKITYEKHLKLFFTYFLYFYYYTESKAGSCGVNRWPQR
ncbi:MAG: hypothetical protein AB2693_32425, partial [Candidatus Thiodiazotropha sp.]